MTALLSRGSRLPRILPTIRLTPPLSRYMALQTLPTPWAPNNYPHAYRSDRVDVYKSTAAETGRVEVRDPYEWLERSSLGKASLFGSSAPFLV